MDLDPEVQEVIALMMVHEVPLIEPLNVKMPEVEAMASQRIGVIRRSANKLDIKIASSVMRSRAAGKAICQEAERRGSDAIVLASRLKSRKSDAIFGKCVTYVLRHAPCDVVVLCLPDTILKTK